eukprot:XP_011676925.1 PREDICTED: uncharacterized protein LOC105444405 [Strongylocentrotus purpuratus]
MLITWKQRQLPHQNVKEVLLSLLKSEETEAENTKITDITPTGDISDQYLLKLARHIKSTDFMEIGKKLGFSRNKLENFKHKTLQNRKDANIQMLCTWKASQRSGAKATETLKCILESVSLASAENTGNCSSFMNKEEDKEDEELEGNSTSPPEQETEQSESVEPEDMSIIRNSVSDGDETSKDFDLCGGSPSTGEQCSVALPVKSLSLAWELGKALRLDDDVIVVFVAPSDSAAMNRLAWQLLNKRCKCLGSQEKKVVMTKLLQDYHIQDCNSAMEHHQGFLDPFSHGIIDHDGGELNLDELNIRVSIPAGAIPKGMTSVVTLSVPGRRSSKIPLKDGDVLVTPVIECSFTQELLKPATVVLPHCIHPEKHQYDLRVSLYTKIGPDTFGYRSLLPNTSRDFHISEGMVGFSTRHLQLWGLSSSNVNVVQFTCEVFQPLFMLPSQKLKLRICIAHPCNRYPDDMYRRQGSLLEPFYYVATAIKFSLESSEDDLKLWCLSDSEKVQETVPVRCLLNGDCNTLNFGLLSSNAEGGANNIYLRIEQGTSTLAEQQIPTSMEVEPDYGDSHTRDRIQIVSDNTLKFLSGLVCAIKDARDLGYQLGFSHSAVERYLDRADSSASSVSSSGFKEMLRDWRRRVRPNEQVNKLRLALEEAGLRSTAEVLFHES